MKNYTTSETIAAKKIAYNFIFSNQFLKIQSPFRSEFRADKRTRIGNLSIQLVRSLERDSKTHQEAKEKKISRRKNRPFIFSNILDNAIVKDYKKNSPTHILENRLRFGNRNHWAKNERDLRVLEILIKNQ